VARLLTYRNSLFDMDGTLVDSVAGVTAAWEVTAKKYPGKDINVKEILSSRFSLVTSFSAYNPVIRSNSWYQDRRKPSQVLWDRGPGRTRGEDDGIVCQLRRLSLHLAGGRRIRDVNRRGCCSRRRHRQTSRCRCHHAKCMLSYHL